MPQRRAAPLSHRPTAGRSAAQPDLQRGTAGSAAQPARERHRGWRSCRAAQRGGFAGGAVSACWERPRALTAALSLLLASPLRAAVSPGDRLAVQSQQCTLARSRRRTGLLC